MVRAVDRSLEIIIPNWNTWDLIRRAANVLRPLSSDPNVRLTIVDNASTDPGADVTAAFPWLNIIRLPTNVGYAAANNWVLERTHADFVLLQNSDAFPTPQDIVTLLDQLAKRPRAAAIAPALVTAEGRPQVGSYGHRSSAARWICELAGLPALPGLGESGIWGRAVIDAKENVRSVAWVSGACLLVRMSAVRNSGLMTERYFMYMEDMDWCERFRRNGWDVLYLPSVTVTHLFAASQTSTSTRWIEAARLYVADHHSKAIAALLPIVGFMGFAWRAAAFFLLAVVLPSSQKVYVKRGRRMWSLAGSCVRSISQSVP